MAGRTYAIDIEALAALPAIEADAAPKDEDIDDGTRIVDEDGWVVAGDMIAVLTVCREGEDEERAVPFSFVKIHEFEEREYAVLMDNLDKQDEEEVEDDEDEEDDAPTEIYIFRYEADTDGVELYVDIEDEAEFTRVRESFQAALDALVEEQEDEEDEA